MNDENDKPDRPTDPDLPEPPDLRRVHDLRERMRRDRQDTAVPAAKRAASEIGHRARDIGMYTIIPMMMVVGPALGYLAGLVVEKYAGGKPWPTVVGLLWGLAAAFRQIYLLLKRKSG